jgi:hypothetical protein
MTREISRKQRLAEQRHASRMISVKRNCGFEMPSSHCLPWRYWTVAEKNTVSLAVLFAFLFRIPARYRLVGSWLSEVEPWLRVVVDLLAARPSNATCGCVTTHHPLWGVGW